MGEGAASPVKPIVLTVPLLGEGAAVLSKPKVLKVPSMGEGEAISKFSFNMFASDVAPELAKIFKKHMNLVIEHELS